MSSNEDIAFHKLSMLMKAVTEANDQDDTLEELLLCWKNCWRKRRDLLKC